MKVIVEIQISGAFCLFFFSFFYCLVTFLYYIKHLILLKNYGTVEKRFYKLYLMRDFSFLFYIRFIHLKKNRSSIFFVTLGLIQKHNQYPTQDFSQESFTFFYRRIGNENPHIFKRENFCQAEEGNWILRMLHSSYQLLSVCQFRMIQQQILTKIFTM